MGPGLNLSTGCKDGHKDSGLHAKWDYTTGEPKMMQCLVNPSVLEGVICWRFISKNRFLTGRGFVGSLCGVPGIKETIKVAEQVNALGAFDAVIHNAGVGYREHKRIKTVDGLAHVFAVNAPGSLTYLPALSTGPEDLVYISSGLHRQGDPSLEDIAWQSRPWSGFNAYADSKLYDVILCHLRLPGNGRVFGPTLGARLGGYKNGWAGCARQYGRCCKNAGMAGHQ